MESAVNAVTAIGTFNTSSSLFLAVTTISSINKVPGLAGTGAAATMKAVNTNAARAWLERQFHVEPPALTRLLAQLLAVIRNPRPGFISGSKEPACDRLEGCG